MKGKWDHVVQHVDNWIWVGVAVGVYITAKVVEVPEMNALAGACLVMVKGNGQKPEVKP